MTTPIATRGDVYRFGLPRGLLGTAGREVASSAAATDVLELDGHGFETDDEVVVRHVEGGSLPAPLAAGTTYYVIRVSDSAFKLATTAGGSAIDLTSAGDRMIVATKLPFDEVLEFYTQWVYDQLPAHLVPLPSPVPIVPRMIVAQLASKALLRLSGQASVAMTEAELDARAQVKRWVEGQPLRDVRATSSANLAVVDTMSGSVDRRGWGSGTLP